MHPYLQLILAYSSVVIVLSVIIAFTKKNHRHSHIIFWSLILALVIFSLATYARYFIVPYGADQSRQDFLLSGDEPAYLMTALSIAKDGDLNVENNAANKDYLLFQKLPYKGYDFAFFNTLAKNRLASKQESWGNSHYMRHRPGTAFMISPVFLFADSNHRFWAYTLISFCFSLFCGFSCYFLAKKSSIQLPCALTLCLVCGLSPPVFFYLNQVYPEIFAGTLLALISLLFILQTRFRILPFILAAIAIWFNDRVILPTLIICAGGFFSLPTRNQQTAAFFILGMSGMMFALYCWQRFGVPYPVLHNTAEGYVFSYGKIPERIFQILFDARQGWVWLFPPVLLLPAILWQVIINKNLTLTSASLAAALVAMLLLIASFDDYGAGTCPRGRYFVIPQLLFMILASVWLQEENGRKIKMIWFVGLGSLSLMQIFWLIPNPKWWFGNFHPFFSWREIHVLIFNLPFLPDNAEHSEWMKLLKMSPILILPSLSCIFFRRNPRTIVVE